MTSTSQQPEIDADAVFAALQHFASPAALRNAGPLAKALEPILPDTGTILEVASGSGFHAAMLAASVPALQWQPSEADPNRLADLKALTQSANLPNLLPPVHLDAISPAWPISGVQGVLCLNMIHIAPWTVAEGLMRGVSTVLVKDGSLYLYGPFKRGGEHTAPSNESFDENLRARNPEWGVRDDNAVDALADTNGLMLHGIIEMPANNLLRIYKRCS